jgi:hypothetical protein
MTALGDDVVYEGRNDLNWRFPWQSSCGLITLNLTRLALTGASDRVRFSSNFFWINMGAGKTLEEGR